MPLYIFENFFNYISSKKFLISLMNLIFFNRNKKVILHSNNRKKLKKCYYKDVQKLKKILDNSLHSWKEFNN